MAGVSDKPYRKVCRAHGAGLVVSEMVTSQLDLQHTTKSKFRLDLEGEPEPVMVQIVGTEPLLISTWAAQQRKCAKKRLAPLCLPMNL